MNMIDAGTLRVGQVCRPARESQFCTVIELRYVSFNDRSVTSVVLRRNATGTLTDIRADYPVEIVYDLN